MTNHQDFKHPGIPGRTGKALSSQEQGSSALCYGYKRKFRRPVELETFGLHVL